MMSSLPPSFSPPKSEETSQETSPQGDPQSRQPTGPPPADDQAAERAALCDENHRALKTDEAAWQAARFGGYQPLGFLLGELRYCPVCESGVVRLVRFTTALLHVLDHLLCPQRPGEIYVRAASALAAWAERHLPGQLGVAASPAPVDQSAICDRREDDWRQLGQELRQWRERAGLTRSQLSALTGIADSTIRNYETGRHRPTINTLHRLCTVAALRRDSDEASPEALAEAKGVKPI